MADYLEAFLSAVVGDKVRIAVEGRVTATYPDLVAIEFPNGEAVEINLGMLTGATEFAVYPGPAVGMTVVRRNAHRRAVFKIEAFLEGDRVCVSTLKGNAQIWPVADLEIVRP